MNETILTDDFGRRTVFTGELLVEESTDSAISIKPQWLEVGVWRTQAGNFVVRRITRYRVLHLDDECEKADGYELSPSNGDEGIYPCRTCNRHGETRGGWRQDDRITVEVYATPQDLIAGFRAEDGRFSNLSRTILADIAEQDDRVDAVWNTVVVP
jgi:hypothetical protein